MRALAAALCLLAAEVVAQEVTAARTLRPGTVLAAGDLAGPPAAVEAFVGLEVRRAVYAARPVRADDLGPATLVRRNEVVTMVYRAPGLAIRTDGRALEPGGEGERVRVMNLSSRQRVIARVLGPGMVEVAR